MSRTAVLGLVAAILAVVGVPVAVVGLAGDGGEPPAGRTVFPEGIDTENAPAEQLDPEPRDRPNGRGQGAGKQGGGPPRSYPESGNVAYPNDVTRSGGDVARTVERHLGATAGKAGELTVIGADCRAGACSARYVSGPHGGGRIVGDAAVILRRLFADPGVRSVRLFVHEPRGRRAKTVEPMALAVIACRRADHPSFAWSRLTARQLPRRCSLVEQSPGKLGSQIRRGNLSEHAASRGRSATSGGRAGATSETAPPGAKPAGSPAPETVKGSGGAEASGR